MSSVVKKPKSPTTAALLNAFPLVFGLGYIYIGKWVRFVVVLAIQIFSLGPMTMLGLRQYNVYLLGVVWVVSMVDVHALTKTYNEQLTSPHAVP